MKIISCLIFLMITLGAYAQEKQPYDPSKQRPSTPEERLLRKQWVLKRKYEHFGGDIVRPGTQKGH